ncbi:MAG TPA: hypothetical protein VLD67_12805 [Vicinamibacterales bacterium]|nr:hypothetical protein [Vicinamibacterales bacterium]
MAVLTPRSGLFVLMWCLALPPNALAGQPPQQEAANPPSARGTYLKIGLAHWQGDIFKEGILTQWTVDLFGADYNLTSVNAQIETYFGGPFLISGFSIGYRKDDVRFTSSGHMVNATLFRDIGVKAVAIKAGGGIEWGVPSLNFDQTQFAYAGDGTVRYRHTYPDRNARVPFVRTATGGSLYPFVELSVVHRPGALLLEGGIRINFIGFHFDDYEVSPGGDLTHVFHEGTMTLPYLFVNLGIKLF